MTGDEGTQTIRIEGELPPGLRHRELTFHVEPGGTFVIRTDGGDSRLAGGQLADPGPAPSAT